MRSLMARLLAAALQRRFRAAQAAGLTAVIEMRVRGPGGRAGIPLGVAIADGHATVSPGAPADAGAVASIGIEDLLRLVRGSVGWPELLSTGRMELAGDPFLALRLPNLFSLPTSPRREGPPAPASGGARRSS